MSTITPTHSHWRGGVRWHRVHRSAVGKCFIIVSVYILVSSTESKGEALSSSAAALSRSPYDLIEGLIEDLLENLFGDALRTSSGT
jgi:hypothetical protein